MKDNDVALDPNCCLDLLHNPLVAAPNARNGSLLFIFLLVSTSSPLPM